MKIDLKQRERDRIVQSLGIISEAAAKLADAIRDGDDAKGLTHLVMLILHGRDVDTLIQVYAEAARADLAADEFDTLAEAINGEAKGAAQ